jgi:hypothetical protein
VNRAIFARGGFLSLAKPSHMSRRSGGEPGEPAGFLKGLSTRARPRIFFDGVALPACAAQNELVSPSFVDHPLDHHECAEFTIFLVCDYHVSTGEAIAVNFFELGTYIAFVREWLAYQLLIAGFLPVLLSLVH